VRGGRWGGQVQFGGGGILSRGTTIITNSAVTNNVSTVEVSGGGGILSFGRLFIARSIVADNQATQASGGGILSPAAVTVISSTIRHNIAEDTGGGIAISSTTGNVTIIGTTISENRVGGGDGGGLYSLSSAVAVVNTTFARNAVNSGFGGGLNVAGGVVVNTTIADNDSDGGGRALAATSALALHNTIVSGPSDPFAFACQGRITSLDNNMFFDPNCAVAVLPHDRTGDPGLGDYIDFGFPGQGFFLLTANSPALDAGDNAACLATDQRGQLRAGGGCDVGAIEGTNP
jgi:hypothetical protein